MASSITPSVVSAALKAVMYVYMTNALIPHHVVFHAVFPDQTDVFRHLQMISVNPFLNIRLGNCSHTVKNIQLNTKKQSSTVWSPSLSRGPLVSSQRSDNPSTQGLSNPQALGKALIAQTDRQTDRRQPSNPAINLCIVIVPAQACVLCTYQSRAC